MFHFTATIIAYRCQPLYIFTTLCQPLYILKTTISGLNSVHNILFCFKLSPSQCLHELEETTRILKTRSAQNNRLFQKRSDQLVLIKFTLVDTKTLVVPQPQPLRNNSNDTTLNGLQIKLI